LVVSFLFIWDFLVLPDLVRELMVGWRGSFKRHKGVICGIIYMLDDVEYLEGKKF
jgi:hypothetical protein